MRSLLTPWLAVADRHVPGWRTCVASHQRIRLGQQAIDSVLLLELREALELCALARAIDGASFMAALQDEALVVCSDAASVEALWLNVVYDDNRTRTASLDTFFTQWTEATASATFQTARQDLEKLRGNMVSIQPVRFHVKMVMEITNGSRSNDVNIARMSELLHRLGDDSNRFVVGSIELTFSSAKVECDGLSRLFRGVVMWYGRGTTVDITLQLPGKQQEDDRSFTQWRHLFHLVARRGESTDPGRPAPLRTVSSVRGGDWNVQVECSTQDSDGEMLLNQVTGFTSVLWTTARLFAACLAALVLGDVTSIRLHRPFEDVDDDFDSYYARPERTAWVAFLLRFGVAPSIHVDFATLVDQDVASMAVIFEHSDKHVFLEWLWEESWGDSDSDSEQEAVVRFRTDVEQLVDDALNAKRSAHHHHPVESLVCRLNDYDPSAFCRFAGFLGPRLGALDVDFGLTSCSTTVVVEILRVCPALKKLTVGPVGSVSHDIDLDIPAGGAMKHPLKSLSLRVCHMNALAELPHVLEQCGVALNALCLADPMRIYRQENDMDPSAIMDDLLAKTSASLTRLEISELPIGWCGVARLWTSEAMGLQTLVLEHCEWKNREWETFLVALREDTAPHPLARALRTLVVRASSSQSESDITQLLDVVGTNQRLVNLDITFAASGSAMVEFMTRARDTSGVSVHRRQSALAMPQKVAFLTALERRQLPWTTEGITRVFDFAAPNETRQVRFSTS